LERYVTGAFSLLRKGIGGLVSKLFSFKTMILGVLGVGGLGMLFNELRATADRTGKFSDEIGISTEAMQAWRLQAELSGTTIQQVERGFQIFARRVGEASLGTGEGVKGLKALGISAQGLSNVIKTQGLNAAILQVFDRLSRVGSAAEKSAIMFSLFSRQGQDMLNMANGATAGFNDAAEKVKMFGLEMDRLEVARFEDVNDRLLELGKIAQGFGMQLLKHVVPAISALTRQIIAFIESHGGVEAIVDKVWGELLKILDDSVFQVETLGLAVYDTADAFKDFGMTIVDQVKRVAAPPIAFLTSLLEDLKAGVDKVVKPIKKVGSVAAKVFKTAGVVAGEILPTDKIVHGPAGENVPSGMEEIKAIWAGDPSPRGAHKKATAPPKKKGLFATMMADAKKATKVVGDAGGKARQEYLDNLASRRERQPKNRVSSYMEEATSFIDDFNEKRLDTSGREEFDPIVEVPRKLEKIKPLEKPIDKINESFGGIADSLEKIKKLEAGTGKKFVRRFTAMNDVGTSMNKKLAQKTKAKEARNKQREDQDKARKANSARATQIRDIVRNKINEKRSKYSRDVTFGPKGEKLSLQGKVGSGAQGQRDFSLDPESRGYLAQIASNTGGAATIQ